MTRAFCICLLASTAMAQILRRPPPPPAEPSVPTGKGSIEGTISDAISQAPLKKAQVSINGPIAGPLTAVTDASGRFAFRQLAAGSYWLNASKIGYNPPEAIFAAAPNSGVVLGDSEQRKGIEIALMPDGSIGGRMVDEEGLPVHGCSVSAAQFTYEQNRRTLRSRGSGSTVEKGEYHISNLAPGRYYAFAHCRTQLPAAHPLLPRGDPRTPHETYLWQFYGGGVDPAAATRLKMVAGASIDGVDFQMTRVPAYTLRGSVAGGDPSPLAGGVTVMLMPVNRTMRSLMQANAGVDSVSRTFQIQAVIPGSYLLTAFSMRDGRMFAAEQPVQIGSAPPNPVSITLLSGVDLKGSVQFDSDDHPPLENGQISLAPMDEPFFMHQLQAQTDKDGAFTLTGVLPGRWRLIVSTPGYLKSASLAGQPVSPGGFQVATGTSGPLRIMLGSKMADVHVEVTGAPADRQVSAAIFPEDPARRGAGLERIGSAMGTGRIEFGSLAPGRYRVFAIDSPNPWPILQRLDWLKALESHSAALDVPEGGRVSTTVEAIPREELMRVLEENE
jgi:protocatechuate 3,4-dioxygenase beta subunit